jgi:hypothetical protein
MRHSNFLNVDIDSLKELYNSDLAARTIFDHLASRQRNSPETSVERLLSFLSEAGPTCSKTEVIQFFKALEEAGCGLFILGRKGRPSRFKWSLNLISVGRAAAGNAASVEAMPEVNHEPEHEASTLTHKYVLRPDFVLSLELPADLSVSEASRLAEFIKTLPFS